MLRFAMYTLGVVFVFAGIAIGIAEYMLYGYSLSIVLGNVLLIVIGVLTLMWAEDVRSSLTKIEPYEGYTTLCNCMVCRAYRNRHIG